MMLLILISLSAIMDKCSLSLIVIHTVGVSGEHGAVRHGGEAVGAPLCAPSQAYRALLLAHVRAPQVSVQWMIGYKSSTLRDVSSVCLSLCLPGRPGGVWSHRRAREALRQCLPEALTDQSFGDVIRSEEAVQRWLAHLLKNLSDKSVPSGSASSANGTGGAKQQEWSPQYSQGQQQQQQQRSALPGNPIHMQGSTWKPPG